MGYCQYELCRAFAVPGTHYCSVHTSAAVLREVPAVERMEWQAPGPDLERTLESAFVEQRDAEIGSAIREAAHELRRIADAIERATASRGSF